MPRSRVPAELAVKRAHLQAGRDAEQLAAQYLAEHGLSLLEKNFRARVGEIDLILLHQDTIVFVEVRFRSGQTHGSAAESVSAFKQRRINRCARLWWAKKGQLTRCNARFDVVTVEPQGVTGWIQSAWVLDFG
ncbi:MAG: YraN family protein [Limnobacter sp.]|nr:YraN family protein [Limnobacter sp.]